MENVIIFGASGHANVIIDIIEKQNKYHIFGIFVDTPGMAGTEILGYPVLGKISEFYGSTKGIIAVGDNYNRRLLANKIQSIDNHFEFVTAIHPSAIIGRDVHIGDGTVIAPGAILNTNVKIGEHCIVNTKASVGHDVTLGNFSTLAPGSTIGGNTIIGNLSTVSLGANVVHRTKIGDNTVIGAGATVVKEIPDGVVAYGTPAQIIRYREPNEKYV